MNFWRKNGIRHCDRERSAAGSNPAPLRLQDNRKMQSLWIASSLRSSQ
jgi:hypothetical protein